MAPPTLSLPLSFAEDGQRALELIFHGCAGDAACAQAFPRLRDRFVGLLARLDAHPEHARVLHPVTGAAMELTLTRRAFMANLHGILYLPEIATLLPLIIDRAADGDFGPFVAQAFGFSHGFGKGLSQGMFFSVICAEDAPLATPEACAAHNDGTWFADSMAKEILTVCKFWPRGELPSDYHQLVRSDTPVLLLSGELDISAVPEAEALAA